MSILIESFKVDLNAIIVINSKSIIIEKSNFEPILQYSKDKKQIFIWNSKKESTTPQYKIDIFQYALLIKSIEVINCKTLCCGSNFNKIVSKFEFKLDIFNNSHLIFQDVILNDFSVNISNKSKIEFSRTNCKNLILSSYGYSIFEGLKVENECTVKSIDISTVYMSICKHGTLNRIQEGLSKCIVEYHLCDKMKKSMLDSISTADTGLVIANIRTKKKPYPIGDDTYTEISDSCKICTTNKSRVVIVPCGHQIFCFSCCESFYQLNFGKNTYKCPMCRQKIQNMMKIYQ
jgi:hypothetical protein